MENTERTKEKDLVEEIFNNIEKLTNTIKLPPIEKVFKEKQLTKDLFVMDSRIPINFVPKGALLPRVDILIQHKDKHRATIVEVKIYETINDLTLGVGQLLFYKEFLKKVSDVTKINLVLISNEIPENDILAAVSKKNNLDISFVEWTDKEVKSFVPVNYAGRESIWQSVEEFDKANEEYFKNNEKPTFSGLADHLGISRQTLYTYDKKDQFSDTIKKSRNKLLKIYEEQLVWNQKQVAGVIFALKNLGWKDRSDITSNDETLKPIPIVDMPKDVLQHNSNQETTEAK